MTTPLRTLEPKDIIFLKIGQYIFIDGKREMIHSLDLDLEDEAFELVNYIRLDSGRIKIEES